MIIQTKRDETEPPSPGLFIIGSSHCHRSVPGRTGLKRCRPNYGGLLPEPINHFLGRYRVRGVVDQIRSDQIRLTQLVGDHTLVISSIEGHPVILTVPICTAACIPERM
jgi:hypothetical protein